jgi:hypothetical protein
MNRWLTGCLIVLSGVHASHAEGAKRLKQGDAVDYAGQGFYHKRWWDRKLPTRLQPCRGKEVVLFTTKDDLDGEVMARLVGRLDAGWELYADLVGKSPRPFELVAGKPCIAAVPERNLFTIPEVCGVTSRDEE